MYLNIFQKKKNVPKYKHNHIGDNDSSSTFNTRTVNLKEKYSFSNQIK